MCITNGYSEFLTDSLINLILVNRAKLRSMTYLLSARDVFSDASRMLRIVTLKRKWLCSSGRKIRFALL